MNIVDYIPYGHEHAVTRKQLRRMTGKGDRAVREMIFAARRETPILNLQDGKGYFIPTEEECTLVTRYIAQETKRLKSIGWALKSAKRYMRGRENG